MPLLPSCSHLMSLSHSFSPPCPSLSLCAFLAAFCMCLPSPLSTAGFFFPFSLICSQTSYILSTILYLPSSYLPSSSLHHSALACLLCCTSTWETCTYVPACARKGGRRRRKGGKPMPPACPIVFSAVKGWRGHTMAYYTRPVGGERRRQGRRTRKMPQMTHLVCVILPMGKGKRTYSPSHLWGITAS